MYSRQSLSKAAIFNTLLLLLGFFLHATASPLAETSLQTRALDKRYEGSPSGKLTDANNGGPGGPDSTDYQSDDDIAAAYVAPGGPFVFFSGIQDSQAPYNFAQTLSPQGSILRGAFSRGFVTRGKPQRSKQWFQDFLDRTSGYFADQAVAAGNPVYFVGKFNGEVNSCSIWSRIELPTLLAGGIQITLVDYTNFGNQKPYPIPDGVLGRRNEAGNLEKRDDKYCADWQGTEEDPADPDSTPGVGLPYYPGNCGVHVVQVSQSPFRIHHMLTKPSTRRTKEHPTRQAAPRTTALTSRSSMTSRSSSENWTTPMRRAAKALMLTALYLKCSS